MEGVRVEGERGLRRRVQGRDAGNRCNWERRSKGPVRRGGVIKMVRIRDKK